MAKRKQHQPGDGTYGNGTISQRGDRFRVRWYEDGRQQSSSGHKSRAEAVDKLAEIQARLELGQPGVEPAAPSLPETPVSAHPGSFGELLPDWVDYRQRFDVRTADAERSRWALHLARPLETQTVRGLTPKWVVELAAELVRPTPGTKAPDGTPKQPISGPTAQRVLTQLSSFYAWAIREGHADTNPAAIALTDKALKRLLAPKSTEHEAKVPLRSWAEVDALYAGIAESSETVAIWYLLQARCGLRPGEATAQRWADIDLDGGTLLVRGSVRHGKYDQTKGGKVREVPLTPPVVRRLRDWRDQVQFEALVCPPPRYFRGGQAGEHMGQYLGTKAIDTAMSAGFTAAKVKPRTPYEAGRVTYATLVGGSGKVSAFTLQKWMGHADVKTTERYVKQQPGLSAGELSALGG